MFALHPDGSARRLPSLALRSLAVVPLVVDVTAGGPVANPEWEYVALILLHPLAVRRAFGIQLGFRHVAWVTTAAVLHQLGMVYGLYLIPWWDHLTHAVSGSVVAAVGYTLARSYARRSGVEKGERWVAAATLAVVLGSSAAWEVYERLTPDLMTYGVLDTTADLAFAVLGTVLVLRFGDRLLREPIRGLTAWLPDPESEPPSRPPGGGHAPGD